MLYETNNTTLYGIACYHRCQLCPLTVFIAHLRSRLDQIRSDLFAINALQQINITIQ